VRVSQPLTSSLTQVRDWTYDGSGRMASFLENGTTTTYSYGPGDQLEQVGDPRGITLGFEYDNLGRQTRRYQAGPPVADDQTFSYDQSGNMLSANVVATSTAITMDYDQDGRLQKVYQASGSPTTTYTYNGTTGRLSSITDPAGTTAFSLYDANGLLKEITDPFSATKVVYTYGTAGRLIKRTDGGNLCVQQTYETGTGRVDTRTVKAGGVACNGVTLASFNLDYDLASNVTRRVEALTGNTFGGTYDYTYDDANRLKTVAGPAAFGSRTYDYDGGGNRTSVQMNTDPAITTTFDARGVPVSSSDGTTYGHDQVGNLTAIDRSGSSNDWFFTYSPWNQLTKAERSAGSADVTYALDALDRILTRASAGATSTYTYQGAGEVLARSDVAGSTTLYAHTLGGPLAQKIGSTTRYYVRDFHGDLVGWKSSTSGSLAGTALYDPWGVTLSGTGDMAVVPTNGAFRFQSDITDSATGQVDMLARLYEPVLGRFSSRDPLLGDPAVPLSLNQYVYGLSSPVTYGDPSGLCADPDICPPQVGFGTTQTHSHEFVRQIGEAGEKYEAAQEYVPPREHVPPPRVAEGPSRRGNFPLIDADVCDPLPTLYYDPITKRFVSSVSVPCGVFIPARAQTTLNVSAGTCVTQTEFYIVTCPSLTSGDDRLPRKVDPYWEYAPGIHGSEGPVGPCRYSRRVCRAFAYAALATILATTACYATGCDPESAEPQEPPSFVPPY
jgi:RHS repeat-associated protein